MKLKFNYSALCVIFYYIFLSGLVYPQSDPPILQSPKQYDTLKTTKPRFTWTGESLTSFELQISKDSTFKTDVKKFTISKDSLGYTLSSTYLELKTTYYWRMRSSLTETNYSSTVQFTIGSPSSTIDNANVQIGFDHLNAFITQLKYKKGSNKNILDISSNEKNKFGLGRVINETASKIVEWSENNGTCVYTYENPLYGSKTLTINYDADGVTVDIKFNLPANKVIKLNSVWLPGGDVGPLHDYILYNDKNDINKLELLKYPSTTSTIFEMMREKGLPPGYISIFDDRYDEYFGYKLPDTSAYTITAQQSLLFGPSITNVSNSKASEFNLQFAIMKKTGFFSWVDKKAVVVVEPLSNTKYVKGEQLKVLVRTFGLTGNISFKMSSDRGKTFSDIANENVTVDTVNGDIRKIKLTEVSKDTNNSQIQAICQGISGKSNFFTVVDEKYAQFIVPKDLTASPTDEVLVPILYVQGSGKDTLVALDFRMYYDNSLLDYKGFTWDGFFLQKTGTIPNWQLTDAVINNSTLGFIQVGTYKTLKDYTGLTNGDTIGTAKFFIKPAARVGTTTSFNLDNVYLSATDNKVKKINIMGSNGLLTFYSKVSGTISYYTGITKPFGDQLVYLEHTTKKTTLIGDIQKTTGNFIFSNVIPGDSVKLYFKTDMKYPKNLASENIKAIDALKAFSGRDGGSTTLTSLQKIAADINKDGIINSFDAYAILKISTGEKTVEDFNLNKWVFIDQSNYTNWTTPGTYKIYAPLDVVQEKQNFYAIMYGDVDGQNAISSTIKLEKSSSIKEAADGQAAPELYIPTDLKASPGDTVSIPLLIKLNGTNLGAFNARIRIDQNKFSNAQKLEGGKIIPWSQGWVISNFYDKYGYMNIAATDLGGNLDPITKDGTLIEFKFVVNKNANIGDTSNVIISNYSLADLRLSELNPVVKHGKITITSNITDVQKENMDFDYSLDQNYPNPFNPSTIISYSIKNEGSVKLDIYNVLGELVTNLVNDIQKAGKYKIEWNASKFPSGIYFCKLRSGDFTQTRKMILIK